ncbi:MAG: LLM class flavin-dependent oxidoreductase [Acetobacteraceae bacterium]
MAALADHAALAERIGFDSVWVIDSQLLCRDVFITLATILSRTTHLRAATGVTQPFTRHASVAAGAMATLAEMSGGRAILGVGTGFSSLGTIGMRQARIADVKTFVDTTRCLLRGQEAAFDNGVSGRLSWIDGDTGVPIVIAATGPRMTRTAGRIADGVIIHQGLAPDQVERALEWVRQGVPDGGDMPVISCWAPYSLAADPVEARNRVRARVAGALANARADWFEGAEREAVERLHASYDITHHASASPDHAAIVPDSLIPRYALAGTAEEVRAQLGRLLDQPGLDRIVITPQVVGAGARPLQDVLREFETEVLGRL